MLTAVLSLFAAVGVANAACANDAACQSLGCKDNVQVVFGNTQIKATATTAPPYTLETFPGATTVGDTDVGGGTKLVTWTASEPSTLVIPKSTPAANGQPGTTWFITTSVFEYNGIRYEKPFVASTTSTSFTLTETQTQTITETSTTTSTTTLTESTTLTTTSTETFCPPPPPCTTSTITPWSTISLPKNGNTLRSTSITINPPAPAYFWLTDVDFKTESYSVLLDGQPLGNTGAFQADKTYQPNPDAAIRAGFSWGKFGVPAGQHEITVNGINFDGNYASFKASWKLEGKCD